MESCEKGKGFEGGGKEKVGGQNEVGKRLSQVQALLGGRERVQLEEGGFWGHA